MPPSRRRPPPSSGQVPPVRRPRVAGLRNRPATSRTEDDPQRESMSGVLDIEDIEDTEDTEPRAAEPEAPGETGTEAETTAEPAGGADEEGADEEGADDPTGEELTEPAPAPGRRPAGKRRATGAARPADLTEAEAGTRRHRAAGTRGEVTPRSRGGTQLSVAIVLAVVAVVLAGLAVWFRGESSDLTSGDANSALTDSATTSEVLGQLKSAIEDTFSYNYTDLAATQKAVDATLTGKARCEYDQLFSQVKELAPKQKIIMATAVRDIALVRLDGDRAEALVFIDQSSTRVDVNNSVAGEAQFGVLAKRDGDHWKITEFNMFDQHLVNGQPAPKC